MLYLSALTLFFALHFIPYTENVRQRIVRYGGEKRYKVICSLAIFGTIAMGVAGWSSFPNTYFYEPSIELKRLHFVIMFVAVYLWVAAEFPNNLKRFVRHPMLTGMKLWALGHLLANGDLRSMILFVSFLLFSVFAVMASNARGEKNTVAITPFRNDILAFGLSILIYALLIHFHGTLFGMPITPYLALE